MNVRARLIVTFAALWTALPRYDQPNVDRFLAQALPQLTAAQTATVRLCDAYLVRALGVRPQAIDERAVIAQVRGDLTAEQTYVRPFRTLWWALGRGEDWAAAQSRAARQLRTLVAADLEMTLRDALRAAVRG